MTKFCSELFGLSRRPRRDLLRALEDLIGVDDTGPGITLNWRLLYVDLKHRARDPDC